MKQKLFILALFVFAAVKMNAQCSAAFNFTVNGSSVTCTATGSNSTFSNYFWTLGNGTSSYGTSVTTNYNAAGNYVICLYVSDSIGGCTDSVCQMITTTTGGGSTSCSASFTSSANASGATSFTSTGFGANAANAVNTWTFGDGTSGTGANPTHTYASSGTYLVCHYMQDSTGTCSDSTCNNVTISLQNPCNANFYIYPDSNGAPHTYIGVNTSTGSGLAYTWSWGDGTTTTGAYPSHTYASAGTYVITLMVTGNNGCVDTFSSSEIINKALSMYSINFAAPTSINNIVKEQQAVYPNPAQNLLHIQGDKNATYTIDIFTLNGSKVLSTKTTGAKGINISELQSALYLVKITDASGASKYAKFTKE